MVRINKDLSFIYFIRYNELIPFLFGFIFNKKLIRKCKTFSKFILVLRYCCVFNNTKLNRLNSTSLADLKQYTDKEVTTVFRRDLQVNHLIHEEIVSYSCTQVVTIPYS